MYLFDRGINKILRNSLLPSSRHLTNQRGNAVLFVLSSVVVLGAFLQTTGFEKIVQGNSVITSSRAKTSRDAIAYQIERYSKLPATFRNSLASNDNLALQNCILGSGVTACNGDGTEYPLNLYSPTAPVQRLSGPGPVTNNQPVLYDTKGNLCPAAVTNATLSCPFEVYTTFTATCPIAIGSPCPKAESITVHYIIRTPDNLFSYSGSSSLALLATPVDKFAAKMDTSAILPPAFGYIPNPINVVTLIPVTVVTTTISTYDNALAAILAVVGGNSTLATTIANRLYNDYGITDLALITAFANYWLQSPAAADAGAKAISWRYANWQGYTVTATFVNEMAEAITGISDPTLAAEVAASATTDIPKAIDMANALVGITDPRSRLAIATAGVTELAISQAIEAAIVQYDLPQIAADALAAAAFGLRLDDVALLKTYARVAKEANVTWYWTVIAIVNEGLTTVAQVEQSIANTTLQWEAEAAAAAAAPPTTTTVITTSSVVPADLTTACTDATTCATTMGM